MHHFTSYFIVFSSNNLEHLLLRLPKCDFEVSVRKTHIRLSIQKDLFPWIKLFFFNYDNKVA